MKGMKTIKRLSLVIVLFISSCTNLTLSGLYKVSQLDPFTIDPQQLAVAVAAPKTITIKQGNVKMNLSYHSNDGSVDVNHDFFLMVDNNLAPNLLNKYYNSDQHITNFKLSLEDSKQLATIQKQMFELKEKEIKGRGSFSIGVENLCIKTPLDTDSEIDIYLQTVITEGHFLFLEGVDANELTADSLAGENIGSKHCQTT